MFVVESNKNAVARGRGICTHHDDGYLQVCDFGAKHFRSDAYVEVNTFAGRHALLLRMQRLGLRW